MAYFDQRLGFDPTTTRHAELPAPFAALGRLFRRTVCAVRADETGLRAADGSRTPWSEIDRLAMKRNLLGLPHLLVRRRDGRRAKVAVPLGVPAAEVDRFVEVVDSHYRPAR